MARRGAAVDHGLAAVPVVWLAALFGVPLIMTLVLSFGHSGFGSVELGFSPANYLTVFTTGLYLQTFVRTVLFAIGCSAICLITAYPLGYTVARVAGRRRGIALAVIGLPYLTSLLIRVMSWQILLGQGSVLERALHTLHLLHGPLTILDSLPAVIIGTVAVYLPIATIALALVLDRIPAAVTEASRDLGASRWQTLWHVTLPLSRPGIATAALLTTVPMLGELVIPQVLGGGKGLFLAQAISTQYIQSQNFALGSAMVIVLVAVIGVVVAVLVRLSRGFTAVGR